MAIEETSLETIEYKLVLVQPDSRKVMVLDATGGHHLPTVRIPPWTRPAERLCKAVRDTWGLYILVLDMLTTPAKSPFVAVAELLIPDGVSGLKAVTLSAVEGSELGEEQCIQIEAVLSDDSPWPFSRIGWIDEAVTWLEMATGKKLTSKKDIEQYNAGGGFSLVCFRTEGNRNYWLKATGEPNVHELPVTALLSEVAGAYLPEMIASRPNWNAWIMAGEGRQVTELPHDPFRLFSLLEDAVESMAELQMRTRACGVELLNAGAAYQGMGVFQMHSAALFDYLEEAMSLQTSTKVPRIDNHRIQEIRATLEDVCHRMGDLDIPDTIVHGDMNQGNILTLCGRCQFVDWAEAYVSIPFITLQHLLLLNKIESPEIKAFVDRLLKDRYKEQWLATCDPTVIDKGLIYMPLIAVASRLYGRGDWLHSQARHDPRRQSYARSLARHMDRAARDPELLEALCH